MWWWDFNIVFWVTFLLLGGIFVWPPRCFLYFIQKHFNIWFVLPNHSTFCDSASSPVQVPHLCLTLDDGPSEYTHMLLQVLRKYKVKATFFVIGSKCQQFPDVLRQIISDGHTLGNHDWFDRNSSKVAHDVLYQAVKMTNHKIKQISQSLKPLCISSAVVEHFRPGCGWINSMVQHVAQQLKLQLVLGDCYFHDCLVGVPWLQTCYMKHRIQPGSIVILHEGTLSRTRVTADVLEDILPYFQRLGYQWTTLPSPCFAPVTEI